MGGIWCLLRTAGLLATVLLAGCALIAPYDATYDQSLNKLSEETAKFTASAAAGGPERSITSKEATAYYAATYNLLDRLSQRARVSRGLVPCPTNASLKAFSQQPTSSSPLPQDYTQFDCREFQLYAVRYYVDQLKFANKAEGGLNAGRARVVGGQLQTAIMGAIQTFIVNKTAG
jgi:hypothetical protein